MKNDLKISKLAIVCVLCTAVSGAYAASSVRSLGGSGTYTSASSAAEANASSSVRGGSVRVTPSSGVSGTSTTVNAGTTTSGRVATTPRLSIGQYLGGTTSVSGGSSLRPQTPSGGSSSSGGSGSIDEEFVEILRSDVDELQGTVETLRQSDERLEDQLLDKQDALVPGQDGYIFIDTNTNEIFVEVDALEEALKDSLQLSDGKDGREVELGYNETELLWRYNDGSPWEHLIYKSEITGPQGPQGEKGEKGDKGDKGDPGDAADLSNYPTLAQMDSKIATAIASIATTYATKDELALKADKTELAAYATTEQLNAKADATDVEALDMVINAAGTGLTAQVNNALQVAGGAQDMAEAAQSTAEAAQGTAEAAQAAANEAKAGLATKANAADVYTKSEVYNKQEIEDKVAEIVAGDGVVLEGYVKKEDFNSAINLKADTTYVDQELDKKADVVSVSALETEVGDINDLAISAAEAATQAINELDLKASKTELDSYLKSDTAASTYATKEELGTKANASDVQTITESVTNITQQVNQITNPETGLAAQVDDAVSAAEGAQQAVTEMQGDVNALKTTVGNESSGLVKDVADAVSAAGAAVSAAEEANTLAGKAESDAAAAQAKANQVEENLNLKENLSNKVSSITEGNQNSQDAYPSVGAIVKWTDTKIESLSDSGLPVNPDNFNDNSISGTKLENDTVTQGKLSPDVQQVLNNAVTVDDNVGANKVLGTDDTGAKVWYDII